MTTSCSRCGRPASSAMSFDYGARRVWVEDFPSAGAGGSYPLCEAHADRMRAPVGWHLDDLRSMAPVLPFRRDVA